MNSISSHTNRFSSEYLHWFACSIQDFESRQCASCLAVELDSILFDNILHLPSVINSMTIIKLPDKYQDSIQNVLNFYK